jgi:hypothetical protein
MSNDRHPSGPYPREPDEDTDPDGPSQSERRIAARRAADAEAEKAEEKAPKVGSPFALSTLPTWAVIAGIAAVLTAASWVVGFDTARATTVAKEQVEIRVAPLEKRIDVHVADDAAEKRVQAIQAKQLTDALLKVDRKLDALCRASTRPQICLGEN